MLINLSVKPEKASSPPAGKPQSPQKTVAPIFQKKKSKVAQADPEDKEIGKSNQEHATTSDAEEDEGESEIDEEDEVAGSSKRFFFLCPFRTLSAEQFFQRRDCIIETR